MTYCCKCRRRTDNIHYGCQKQNCNYSYCEFCVYELYLYFYHVPDIFGTYAIPTMTKCICGLTFNKIFFSNCNLNIDSKYILQLSKLNKSMGINFKIDKFYKRHHINSRWEHRNS